jgi:hypothetical protein
MIEALQMAKPPAAMRDSGLTQVLVVPSRVGFRGPLLPRQRIAANVDVFSWFKATAAAKTQLPQI